MVTVPEILTAMATKIDALDGVKSAHYPAPSVIDQDPGGKPVVVLYWGSDEDTVIDNDMRRRRMWLPAVKAQILIAAEGTTPKEFAVIDNVITPITDVFDAGTATEVLPSLGGHVDRCQVVRVRPTLMVNYAGSNFYAAEIFFSIKFHRSVP